MSTSQKKADSEMETEENFDDEEIVDGGDGDEYNYLGEDDNEDYEDNAYNFDQEDDVIMQKNTDNELPYRVLTPKEMLEQQNKDLMKISEILSISQTFARTLLMFFYWDTEILLDIFFTKGKAAVYARAGLTDNDLSSMGVAEEKSKSFDCSVCFEEVDIQDTFALSCGHRMCNGCWQTHVNIEVKEGRATGLACMAKGCNVKFDEAKLVQFLDHDQREKYSKKLLESFVEDNNRVKWCTSVPHCGNAIMISPTELTQVEVRCNCGHNFCFTCSGEVHSPCSCQMIRVWNRRVEEKKEHDIAFSAKMAKMNIRECPKCGARVERVSGCNLMTCRCGQHFCWLCGGATGFNHTWDSIEGHQCGRFSSKGLSELGFDEEGKELPEEVNQRFEFYKPRYDAHVESCKLEKNLIPNVKKRLELVIDCESEFYLLWYCHGLEKLFECRKILTWSYIFCFCLFEPEFRYNRTRSENESYRALFENYQQGMETAIECLSKALESKDQITPQNSKQLISMIVAVDARCAGIYDSINEIFQNSDYRVSPYKRTTEGTSTLLIKPTLNLLDEIKNERKLRELRSAQKIMDDVDGITLPEDLTAEELAFIHQMPEEDAELQKALLKSISEQ